MANVAYPPFFPSQILDGDGQPVANGSIRAAFAGSDVPAPLFTPDGTALGSSVTLNSSGEAVFCLRAGTAYKLTCLDAQGATVWTRDNVRVTTADSGMANPMEAEGDMIVGAVDGQPERLAPPANASFLRSYKNSDNVPVVKWSQLKAGANVTITDAGTQVTVAADTQTGDHKVSTDGADTAGYLEDKVAAGTGISVTKSSGQLVVAATGADTNEVKTSASDDHPGYLQSKVLAGDLIRVDKEQTPDGDGGYTENLRLNLDARGVTAGYVPTADGSNGASWAAPATQPGDHQLLVSATDAAAGYLGAKLVPGSNITLTPQTDGDGVQTLEISATGGGGAAKGILLPWGAMVPGWFVIEGISGGKTFCVFGRTALRNCTIKKVLIGTFAAEGIPSVNELGVYAMRSNRALTLLGKTTSASATVDGSMMFEFTTPLSVGDEIIFLGHLCGATYQSTKVAYIRSVVTGVLYNPTLPPNMGTTYSLDNTNTGSRLGFVWGDRTLQSLPASTAPSDWNYNFNYLPLPYAEVFYE